MVHLSLSNQHAKSCPSRGSCSEGPSSYSTCPRIAPDSVHSCCSNIFQNGFEDLCRRCDIPTLRFLVISWFLLFSYGFFCFLVFSYVLLCCIVFSYVFFCFLASSCVLLYCAFLCFPMFAYVFLRFLMFYCVFLRFLAFSYVFFCFLALSYIFFNKQRQIDTYCTFYSEIA